MRLAIFHVLAYLSLSSLTTTPKENKTDVNPFIKFCEVVIAFDDNARICSEVLNRGNINPLLEAYTNYLQYLEQYPKKRKELEEKNKLYLNILRTTLAQVFSNHLQMTTNIAEFFDRETKTFFTVFSSHMKRLEKAVKIKKALEIESFLKAHFKQFNDAVLAVGKDIIRDWRQTYESLKTILEHFKELGFLVEMARFEVENQVLDKLCNSATETLDSCKKLLEKEWGKIGTKSSIRIPFDIITDNEILNSSKILSLKNGTYQESTISIDFIHEPNALALAKRIMLEEPDRSILVINSGQYVDFSACPQDPPHMPKDISAKSLLRAHYEISPNVFVNVLSTYPVPLRLPESIPLLDMNAANKDGNLIVSPRGYLEMKRRIFLQFRVALQFSCDTIVVSCKYGSGDPFKNNPVNVFLSYSAAQNYFGNSILRCIIFAFDEKDEYCSVMHKAFMEDRNELKPNSIKV